MCMTPNHVNKEHAIKSYSEAFHKAVMDNRSLRTENRVLGILICGIVLAHVLWILVA